MLDFYLIKNATPDENHGMLEQDYLGGIDFTEFEQLQDEMLIEEHLDYYKDFRWTSDQVAVKSNLIENKKNKDFKLTEILRKAKEQNCGVIAYCD